MLKGKKSFSELFAKNRRFRSRSISLVYRKADRTGAAVCVGRSAGNSVQRNRLKRIVREHLNPYLPKLKKTCRLALLPDREFAELKPEERNRRIVRLLESAGLLDEDRG